MQPPRILHLTRAFVESARRLPREAAAAANKAMQELMHDPGAHGLALEKLSGAAEGLYSLRVDRAHRMILSLEGEAATLFFVGPHDEAYRRAGVLERVPGAKPAAPHHLSIPAPKLRSSGRYLPLAEELLTRPGAEPLMEMRFDEIEQLLGEPLPAAARKQREWWANDPHHVQALAWLMAGCETAAVDLRAGTVQFHRR